MRVISPKLLCVDGISLYKRRVGLLKFVVYNLQPCRNDCFQADTNSILFFYFSCLHNLVIISVQKDFKVSQLVKLVYIIRYPCV